MSNTAFFVEHYLVTVLAACGFLAFMRWDCTERDGSIKNFFVSTLCILALIAAETAEHYYAGLESPCTMRVVASAVAYSVRPAIAYFLAAVPARELSKKSLWLLSLPLLFNVLVSFSALVSPLAFSFDAGNNFTRGPLGYVPFAVSAYYLAVLLFFGFRRWRSGQRQEAVICAFAVFLCALCSFLETSLDHVCKLPAMALLGEIYYFMHLLMTRYSLDQLTGAYVRKHLYKEVEARNAARYYITFDVNGLKRINDRYGHAAGDHALVTFSDAVRMSLPSNAIFYRLGGDEFAIIYRTAEEEEAKAMVRLVKGLCTDLPYGVSAGYACFSGGSDFDEASARADAMLYADKNTFWKQYAADHPEEAELAFSRKRAAR